MNRALLLLAVMGCAHAPAHGGESSQLLVVTTETWDAHIGTATLYEREGAGWRQLLTSAVAIGKHGLAWGRGVEVALPRADTDPIKKEGDGRSPAGVFRLGPAFGTATGPSGEWPYRALKDTTECVDDTASAQYAKTVERDSVPIDWKSSEKMSSEPLYRLGAFVEHNTERIEVGAGSCIFLHVWREEGHGTSGCTAFDEHTLRTVLGALKPDANPLLVQLPAAVYAQQREALHWP